MNGILPPEYDVVFFGFLGVCGAAIMVYLYLGEWEKLIGKSAFILEMEGEIEIKRERANEIKDPLKVKEREIWEDMINKDLDRLERARKSLRNLGFILYLFIGGVIAAILANSYIEAVVFGAGWTGFIGAIGIKKDSSERREKRTEEDRKDVKQFEEALKEKTHLAYGKGYTDAIEEIAKVENTNAEEILKKIGLGE